MKFGQVYRGRTRPVISFEVYPPKPESSQESFRAVIGKLVSLRPDFMTVTYGAFGGTRVRTIEIAGMIRREFGVDAACHLTCVGSTPRDIDRILEEVRAAGVGNIVALRGDPPQGEAAFAPPPGGYRQARELVEHLRRAGGFDVAVAGYPEKHLEAPDLDTDIRRLREKTDAGADVVITQLFFDNRFYFEFLKKARSAGIRIPIIPGILPILSVGQVKRITSMCGATTPKSLQTLLEAAKADEAAATDVGVHHAVTQAGELLRAGVPGIHFYVLNKAKHMVRIMEELAPVLAEIEETAGAAGTSPAAR